MATEIYLGNPPEKIVQWIKAHVKPIARATTIITSDLGTREYDIVGTLTKQFFIDEGYWDPNEGQGSLSGWLHMPTRIDIGTHVTQIGSYALEALGNNQTSIEIVLPSTLTTIASHAFYCTYGGDIPGTITLPSSVTSIESDAFEDCSMLTLIIEADLTQQRYSSLSFSGVGTVQVNMTAQELKNTPGWSYGSHGGQYWECTDGTYDYMDIMMMDEE